MIRKTIKGGDFKSQMVGELVFDQVPEEGSFNPVTSDAVVKAIDKAKDDMQEKIDEVTLDPSAVALGNVHLLDEVTEFPADGCILVDSDTNGPANMSKDTLLELTAQNALAGNVAPAFVPTKPNDAGGYAYYENEIVTHQGGTYKFNVNHSSGPWNSAEVERIDVKGIVDLMSLSVVSQTNYTSYKAIISHNSAKWFYYASDNPLHIEIPVKNGQVVRITPLSSNSNYAFLSSDNIPGDKANNAVPAYSSRNNNVVSLAKDVSATLVANPDDAYLILPIRDGGGNEVIWKIELSVADAIDKINSEVNAISSEVSGKQDSFLEKVDLNLFDPHQGVVSGNTNKWYVDSGCSYVALPLLDGSKVRVKCTSVNSNVTFVTSSFSVADKSNNQTVEYSSRKASPYTATQNVYYDYIANSDDAYIIIPVINGIGDDITWLVDVDLKTFSNFKGVKPFVKFRFATWNIGHFSMGIDYNSSVAVEEKEDKKKAYRDLINSVGCDVLGACEDDAVFCVADSTPSSSAIYGCFDNQKVGPKYNYNCNGVYSSSIYLYGRKTINYTNRNQSRYINEVHAILGGKQVLICETQLDWNDVDVRASQISELIAKYKDFPYVIIAGDFNIGAVNGGDDHELDGFLSNGFRMALLDYVGKKSTYSGNSQTPGNDDCLDNIIVKGFSIQNVIVNQASSELSDHRLVSCDLIML